jgi:hypothetical protein
VKPLAILAVTLALVAATARAALAHVDSLGQPDPYWQQIAAATPATDAGVATGGAASLADFVSFGGLSLLLLCLGVALALDLATAPAGLRIMRAAERATDAVEADGNASPASLRTVEVLPPSARGETRYVLRAAAAIVVGVIVVSALHASGRANDSAPRPPDLQPFQVLVRDTTPTVQRMFREIQAGLTQAEQMRVATQHWPAVETLAAQGIPPFPLADSPYRWRLLQEGLYAAYLGAPTPASGEPALLALIQEPGPGAGESASTTPPDELHHRLSDGTLLRVSVWFRPDGWAADDQTTIAAVAQPSTIGWKQVLAGQQGP